MVKRFSILGVLVMILSSLMSGCTSTILSDDRVKSNTAGAIGVSPDDLTISDRHTQGTNTYYVAKTKDGATYACTINGGNLMTMGLVNPPVCTKK